MQCPLIHQDTKNTCLHLELNTKMTIMTNLPSGWTESCPRLITPCFRRNHLIPRTPFNLRDSPGPMMNTQVSVCRDTVIERRILDLPLHPSHRVSE